MPDPQLNTTDGHNRKSMIGSAIILALLGLLTWTWVMPELALASTGTPLSVPELDSIAATLDTQATTWSTPLGVLLVIGGALFALRSAGLAIVGILAGLATVVLPPMIRNLGGVGTAAGFDGTAVATYVISDAEIFSQFAVNPLIWFTVLAFVGMRSMLKTRRPGV